jgi:hypothetical protein
MTDKDTSLEKAFNPWRIVVSLLLVISSLVSGFTASVTSKVWAKIEEHDAHFTSLDEWRAATMASRFTAEDGLKVWQAIGDIRTRLATVPGDYPPSWFVKRVDKLELRLERIEQNQSRILDKP